MKNHHLIVTATLSWILSQSAHADITVLDTIVVTGTKTEKFLKDAPVRTEVVTAETLEKEHATNAADALRYIPGLLLQDIHGKTGTEVWIQGLDSDRVLVLIDGERVSASTGSTIDLTQLSIANIKQIEIVKGASSALYGSSAMGGVINIITHEPESGLHGKVISSGGTFQEKNPDGVTIAKTHARGELSYRTNNWTFMGDIDDRNSKGYFIEDDGFTLKGEVGYKRNGSIGVGFHPSENHTYWLRYRNYREDHYIPNGIEIPGQASRDRPEIVDNNRLSFSTNHRLTQDHELLFKVYKEEFVDETVGSTGIERYAEIEVSGAELQYNGYVSDNYILTAGTVINGDLLDQQRNQRTELNCLDGETRQNNEYYLQLDNWLGDHWEILPGIRYQKDTNFGDHTAPKINAMYSHDTKKGSGRLRISYGNGYRVPNIKEQCYIFDHSHIGYMVLGNPELKAESSDSFQLGYRFEHTAGWHTEINFFQNDIKELIQTPLSYYENINGRAVAIYQYNNVDKALTRGLELDNQFPLSSNVKLRGSYTWLTKAEDKKTHKRLVKRPEHLIKAGLDWQLWNKKADFSLRAVYQSESYLDSDNEDKSPGWTQWDTKFNYNIAQGVSLFSGINNLFDVHKNPENSQQDLRPKEGRTIYAGAKVSF